MGIPTTLGRFAVKEQASGWGTPETVFANANFLEAQITVPTPGQMSVQADVMRASWFATTRVDGGKGPTEISLTMPLHGFSTAAPTGDATEHPDALLLRSVLGGSAQNGYATDPNGGDLNTLNVNAAIANIGGYAVLAPMASTSPVEYSTGWVKTKTTTAYDMQNNFALTAAGATQTPDTAGTIFGSNAVFLSNTQPTPFTMEWLGSAANVSFRFSDCVVTSATIDLNAREQPQLGVTIRSANWTNAGSAGGGAPSPADLANRPQMPVVLSDNGARMVSSTGEQKAGSATITMTAEVADEINYDAPQGISQFVVLKRSTEISVVAPALSGATANDVLANPTSLLTPGTAAGAVQLDAGTTPGRAFSVLIPAGQVKEVQALGDTNSLVSITTVMECAIYSGDTTDGTSDPVMDTPFRIAFL
tara:strand:+ start:1914 stop:3173 length:1260 start_codon:yes stop_codon:yes gene_type:complete